MIRVILIIIAIISSIAQRSIANDHLALLAMFISWLSFSAYFSYGYIKKIHRINDKLVYLRYHIAGDSASNAVADALDIIKDETGIEYPRRKR